MKHPEITKEEALQYSAWMWGKVHEYLLEEVLHSVITTSIYELKEIVKKEYIHELSDRGKHVLSVHNCGCCTYSCVKRLNRCSVLSKNTPLSTDLNGWLSSTVTCEYCPALALWYMNHSEEELTHEEARESLMESISIGGGRISVPCENSDIGSVYAGIDSLLCDFQECTDYTTFLATRETLIKRVKKIADWFNEEYAKVK